MVSRRATHAGSWYVSSGGQLQKQLNDWIAEASPSSRGPARAIISPHAGYSYSGSCAAYAYKQIDPTNIKRVFILGPSHHVFLRECALSPADTYKTPLYNLTIDKTVYKELYASDSGFTTMTLEADEDEHSIEMQLPYIAKAMENNRDYTIVPVMVGSLDSASERKYGKVFSKYMEDPSNLFVISSDFCHWGRRFRYTHYEEEYGEIYKSIEALDNKGMKIIEKLNPEDFSKYLREYGNTICGRHPIGVMLNAVKTIHSQNGLRLEFRFLNYQQSSQCRSQGDSSVSYAAGALVALT